MTGRTLRRLWPAWLVVAALVLACEGGQLDRRANDLEEQRAEDQGHLPGEPAVMVVSAASVEYPFYVVVTRKDHFGEVTEEYNRRIETPAMGVTIDFRTDDQSLSVVVSKQDATEDNVMSCALRNIDRDYNEDEQAGTAEVTCVWVGVVGNEPEA